MAYFGNGENIQMNGMLFSDASKIENNLATQQNAIVLTVNQIGSPINMPNSSRLYISTREISGKGENLTQETVQYWG